MVYSRGGRTDKGVSAAGQVVALELRSKALLGEEPCPEESELDYPGIINRVLSPKIRILGWKTVDDSFSARFSAKSREYKYFFVDQDRKLNLSAMQAAASFLVGEHDFRNFCKADVPNVTNFIRSVLSASLKRSSLLKAGSFSIIELHIEGTAFLWHQVCIIIADTYATVFYLFVIFFQIRCIAAVLLMVGEGKEKPEIVKELLNVSGVNQKPQYSMASEQPLLLYKCSYDGLEFNISENVTGIARDELSFEISRYACHFGSFTELDYSAFSCLVSNIRGIKHSDH